MSGERGDEMKCKECNGFGIVALTKRELIIRCPKCDPVGYAEDCEDFEL